MSEPKTAAELAEELALLKGRVILLRKEVIHANHGIGGIEAKLAHLQDAAEKLQKQEDDAR